MHKNFSTNVLHVFGRMTRGGAEMRTLEIMRHLDRDRFRLSFLALSGREGELDEEIRSLGGKVFYLALKPDFFWRFRSLLDEERISVVHSHVHLSSGFILALAAMQNVPVRIAHFRSMHDGSRATMRKRCQNALMRYWTDRHATRILAVSEGAMASAWKRDWRHDPRCEVIYNGLDLRPYDAPGDREGVCREFGLPPAARICIHVGRMAEAKNHPRLIDIFHSITVHLDDCFLLLVGRSDQALERRLRQKVEDYRLERRVIFAGERKDVPRLLKGADLMIFPSLWEGLPGSVLEACAAGVPVLASDLPGVREIQSWFPGGVLAVSLREPDRTWGNAALSLLEAPKQERFSSHEIFEKTPFRLDLAGERFSRLWGES